MAERLAKTFTSKKTAEDVANEIRADMNAALAANNVSIAQGTGFDAMLLSIGDEFVALARYAESLGSSKS
jgi:hypothetical protein